MSVRVIETDVCIIGSGASGSIIVAAKLAGCGLRVDVDEQRRQLSQEKNNYDDFIGAAEPAMAVALS